MKKAEKKAIAPRIQEATAEWIERMFPSLNAGATMILDAFPHLILSSLDEIKGKFSRGELMMMIDVLNGHGTVICFGSAPLLGGYLHLSIFDSFRLYPGMYEEKWHIENKDDYLSRIASLTRAQLASLEIWIAGLWEKCEEMDFEKEVKKLKKEA